MPYIIAIVLVAVAALVFFSRPSTDEAQTIVTTEAPTETPQEMNSDTEGAQQETDSDDNSNSETVLETDSSITLEADAPVVVSDPPVVTTPSLKTLSSEASYQTPARQTHNIGVTMTLEGNIITEAAVLYNDGEAQTPQHRAFEANYETEVIGKNINNISLSRVGGSSLTTAAFNDAVAKIKAQL